MNVILDILKEFIDLSIPKPEKRLNGKVPIQILIVEDEPSQQDQLYETARRYDENVSVELASTHREAMQKLGNQDILLLDWNISGVTADLILEQWVFVNRSRPVIIVSNYLTTELTASMLVRGAFNVIDKAVGLQPIKNVIDIHIDRVIIRKRNELLSESLYDLEMKLYRSRILMLILIVINIVGASTTFDLQDYILRLLS